MGLINLYPPLLDSTIPAFDYKTDCVIPFEIPLVDNINSIKNIQVNVVYQSNNKPVLMNVSNGIVQNDNVAYMPFNNNIYITKVSENKYTLTIPKSFISASSFTWDSGKYYKAQLRFGLNALPSDEDYADNAQLKQEYETQINTASAQFDTDILALKTSIINTLINQIVPAQNNYVTKLFAGLDSTSAYFSSLLSVTIPFYDCGVTVNNYTDVDSLSTSYKSFTSLVYNNVISRYYNELNSKDTAFLASTAYTNLITEYNTFCNNIITQIKNVDTNIAALQTNKINIVTALNNKILDTCDSFNTWKQYQINSGAFSDWSTAMVFRPITPPSLDILNQSWLNYKGTIRGSQAVVESESSNMPSFIGSFTLNNLDELESELKYKFTLYNENNAVLEETDWLLHTENLSEALAIKQKLSNNSSIDSYVFNTELIYGNTYTVSYEVETINGYQPFRALYTFQITKENNSNCPLQIDILDTVYNNNVYLLNPTDRENARASLGIKYVNNYNSAQLLNGVFVIKRTSSRSNYLKWENLKYITYKNIELNKNDNYIETFYDYIIENGVSYKYGIQEIKNDIIFSDVNQTDNAIFCNFEYTYIYRNGHQLKMSFDNNISSFKRTKIESLVSTLGSQYPTIIRNAVTDYAEFSFTNTVSLLEDTDNAFLLKNNNGLYYDDVNNILISNDLYAKLDTNLTDENVYMEKLFRDYVEKFLNNGDFLLFKSPTEGNFIIGIMGVSLSPNQSLGRQISSIAGTAYEIAACNLTNMFQFGIEEQSTYNLIYGDIIKIYQYNETIYDSNTDIVQEINNTISQKETNNVLSEPMLSHKTEVQGTEIEIDNGHVYISDNEEIIIYDEGQQTWIPVATLINNNTNNYIEIKEISAHTTLVTKFIVPKEGYAFTANKNILTINSFSYNFTGEVDLDNYIVKINNISNNYLDAAYANKIGLPMANYSLSGLTSFWIEEPSEGYYGALLDTDINDSIITPYPLVSITIKNLLNNEYTTSVVALTRNKIYGLCDKDFIITSIIPQNPCKLLLNCTYIQEVVQYNSNVVLSSLTAGVLGQLRGVFATDKEIRQQLKDNRMNVYPLSLSSRKTLFGEVQTYAQHYIESLYLANNLNTQFTSTRDEKLYNEESKISYQFLKDSDNNVYILNAPAGTHFSITTNGIVQSLVMNNSEYYTFYGAIDNFTIDEKVYFILDFYVETAEEKYL